MLKTLFTAHPASVNETYLQHMAMAASFALRLLAGGLAVAVHAVLPFLFQSTGRRVVAELHGRMVTHRIVRPAPIRADGQSVAPR